MTIKRRPDYINVELLSQQQLICKEKLKEDLLERTNKIDQLDQLLKEKTLIWTLIPLAQN